MSIGARQIQETLYSYAAILNFTPSPQGLRAKIWRMLRTKCLAVLHMYINIVAKHPRNLNYSTKPMYIA